MGNIQGAVSVEEGEATVTVMYLKFDSVAY